ncbi:MAG: N-acetylneuraminate synthase family protein [Candidatus Niyogibacteria bacterium]|nr:N-acetylneuraminate synthase family protein [Candidatus Niyogibacteria bacterium]
MAVKVADKIIGKDRPCVIVAEIGINHNGNVEIAKRLIDVAVDAGCDMVKFQKRTVDAVYTKAELLKSRDVPADIIANAIKRGVLSGDRIKCLIDSNLASTTNGDLKYALEFTKEEYREIDRYCQKKGIVWFASPWDLGSVDFLAELKVPCYKVASASLTDHNLLKCLRLKGKPIILSTGMSTMEEIISAVDILGEENLIILHCVATYPSADHDLNLRVIKTLQKRFPNVPIGYSGHERGVAPSVMAVVCGACLIERHITLDRTMWGSDQAASIAPKGLELLVRDIRLWEEARGDGEKRLLAVEIPIKEKLRKK